MDEAAEGEEVSGVEAEGVGEASKASLALDRDALVTINQWSTTQPAKPGKVKSRLGAQTQKAWNSTKEILLVSPPDADVPRSM